MNNELDAINAAAGKYFEENKYSFTGVSAGDYIDKEDFLKFAAQLKAEQDAEIKNLKEVIKELTFGFAEKMQRSAGVWVDVKDRLPDDKQFCLVYNSIAVEPSVYDRNEFYRYPNEIKGDRCALYHFDKTKVTHWMPLPLTPNETPQSAITDVEIEKLAAELAQLKEDYSLLNKAYNQILNDCC